MTDNQEEELIKTLATLVTGVDKIQWDVKEIKVTLCEHTNKLDHLVAKTTALPIM